MKNLKNLGSVLTKTEQKNINGGICRCKIDVPTQGLSDSNQQSFIEVKECCPRINCPQCKKRETEF